MNRGRCLRLAVSAGGAGPGCPASPRQWPPGFWPGVPGSQPGCSRVRAARAAATMEAMAELQGQVVVVIGGSSGMGLETARRARSEGADVILTGRDAGRLEAAAADVGARDTAAFDATDAGALGRFFDGLPATIDHIMLTGGGPYYAPLAELEHARVVGGFGLAMGLPMPLAQH